MPSAKSSHAGRRKQANPESRPSGLPAKPANLTSPSAAGAMLSPELSARTTKQFMPSGQKGKERRALAPLNANTGSSFTSPLRPRTLIPDTKEPTTLLSLSHLFPQIWPNDRLLTAMVTCSKLEDDQCLRDLLAEEHFPKTKEDWVEEFQHALDHMRANVPGNREFHEKLLLEIKEQLLVRHGVSAPVEMEDLEYEGRPHWLGCRCYMRVGYPETESFNISVRPEAFAQRFYTGCPSEATKSSTRYRSAMAGYPVELVFGREGNKNPRRRASSQVQYSDQRVEERGKEPEVSAQAEETFGSTSGSGSSGLWTPGIRAVAKRIVPKATISAEAMSVLNDFSTDMFERVFDKVMANRRAWIRTGENSDGEGEANLDEKELMKAAVDVLPSGLGERANKMARRVIDRNSDGQTAVQFPTTRILSILEKRFPFAQPGGDKESGDEVACQQRGAGSGGLRLTAAVALSTVLETLTTRVLECAGAIDKEAVTISSLHEAICKDKDLAALLDGVTIYNRAVFAGQRLGGASKRRADDRDEAERRVACQWGVRQFVIPHEEFRCLMREVGLSDFMSDIYADGDGIEALHCAAEAYLEQYFRSDSKADWAGSLAKRRRQEEARAVGAAQVQEEGDSGDESFAGGSDVEDSEDEDEDNVVAED